MPGWVEQRELPVRGYGFRARTKRFIGSVLVMASSLCSCTFAQSGLADIEAALDGWIDRTSAREQVLKAINQPVRLLVEIAGSQDQPELRRTHAIALLGTFSNEQSVKGLARLAAKEGRPQYRCLALQALAESKPARALQVLVSSLDDHAICMKEVSTDPGRSEDVYVSDEAVRLLERVTNKKFENKSPSPHRATAPWKRWWREQRRTESSRPGGSALRHGSH